MVTLWKAYFFEPQPLLVLKEEPSVFIPLKRFPDVGDHFRWNNERWRVEDLNWWREDDFGSFRLVVAVSAALPVLSITSFQECPGCGGLIQCIDRCTVGLHREPVQASAPRPQRPKKSRPPLLDAPLKDVVGRRGNVEELSCGHHIHYRFFKFVDRSATMRRCLECCTRCEDVVRTVKRPRIL